MPSKPAPKTILVFVNGERLEADHYTIDAALLRVMVGGQQRTIALSTLDVKATVAVNRQRGIDFKLPEKPQRGLCNLLTARTGCGPLRNQSSQRECRLRTL